ncbi:MAG: undecaprenyl-phosphate galactose phosphotransferase WbaP [Planctomycetaceae bacterium]
MSTTTQPKVASADAGADLALEDFDSAHYELPTIASSASDLRYLAQCLRTALPLFFSDMVSLSASVLISYSLITLLPFPEIHRLGFFLVQFVFTAFVINVSMGLYPGVGIHPAIELRGLVFSGVAVGASSATAAMMIGGGTSPYLILSLGSACLSLMLLFPMRMLTRSICQRMEWWGHPAVIVGPMKAIPQLQRALRSSDFPGVRLVGQFVGEYENQASHDNISPSCRWLGDYSHASDYCDHHQVYWAFIPRSTLGDLSLERFSRKYDLRFRQIFAIDEDTTLPALWGSPVDLGGVAGIHLRERLLLPTHRICKRLFDIVIAAVLAFVLLPLLLLVSIAVAVTSRGPIIYGHRRIGLGGEHFMSFKFRTMVKDADLVLEQYLAANPELREEWQRDHKLKKDPRITCIGSFLRKSSLDELPQLFNVLRGEMSLVGPRPIVDAEIEKYGDAFETYRRVRPGITGLWQISGRNNTTYSERIAYDRFYVRNWSPWFDLYILIRTVKTVLLREGAY